MPPTPPPVTLADLAHLDTAERLQRTARLARDRGPVWDSTRFQDLAACTPEILAAIERHAAGLPSEDATLAAAILQRVAATVDDESARSALRAFQRRLDAA